MRPVVKYAAIANLVSYSRGHMEPEEEFKVGMKVKLREPSDDSPGGGKGWEIVNILNGDKLELKFDKKKFILKKKKTNPRLENTAE